MQTGSDLAVIPHRRRLGHAWDLVPVGRQPNTADRARAQRGLLANAQGNRRAHDQDAAKQLPRSRQRTDNPLTSANLARLPRRRRLIRSAPHPAGVWGSCSSTQHPMGSTPWYRVRGYPLTGQAAHCLRCPVTYPCSTRPAAVMFGGCAPRPGLGTDTAKTSPRVTLTSLTVHPSCSLPQHPTRP